MPGRSNQLTARSARDPNITSVAQHDDVISLLSMLLYNSVIVCCLERIAFILAIVLFVNSTQMSSISKSLIQKLKVTLPDLHIVTPDSPDYAKSIERNMRNTQKLAVWHIFTSLFHHKFVFI